MNIGLPKEDYSEVSAEEIKAVSEYYMNRYGVEFYMVTTAKDVKQKYREIKNK